MNGINLIRETLGGYNDISAIGFEQYKFNTKPSLPYTRVKRAQNIPEVYYDDLSQKVTDQLAIQNYSAQVKENFENIGYEPRPKNVNGNIFFSTSHINQVRKVGFEKLTPLPPHKIKINWNYKNPFEKVESDKTPKNFFINSKIEKSPIKKSPIIKSEKSPSKLLNPFVVPKNESWHETPTKSNPEPKYVLPSKKYIKKHGMTTRSITKGIKELMEKKTDFSQVLDFKKNDIPGNFPKTPE